MPEGTVDPALIEQRFLDAIKHHIRGWKEKVENDFSDESFESELAQLSGDPVYSRFAFNCPEYVLVRLIGRMSISVGRRLGEMYDKLPRYTASARFGLTPEQVAEKFVGLELDIGLRFASLSGPDVAAVRNVLTRFGSAANDASGVGIEIRYNFNPNDSARLRKDVAMAGYLIEHGLLPVYLIYSSISPRDEAIRRLTRGGWLFLQGDAASSFTTDLLTIDFLALMDKPKVRKEIHDEIQKMMRSIFTSPAFSRLALGAASTS